MSTGLTRVIGSVASALPSGSKYFQNWSGTALMVSSYHCSQVLRTDRIVRSLTTFVVEVEEKVMLPVLLYVWNEELFVDRCNMAEGDN